MRELTKKYSWVTRIVYLSAAAMFLTLSGPFGTYIEFTLVERLQFWVLSIAAAGVFIHSIVHFALLIASTTRRMAIMAVLVGTALASVPATAAIMEIHSYLNEIQIEADRYPYIWSNVTLVGFVVATAQFWPQIMAAGRTDEPELSEALEGSADQRPAIKLNVPLLSRLPNCVEPNKIVSFSMQDHYVELMTVKGPHMLLLRFSDAMELLGDLQGLRIHRSHWVSLLHLEGIERSGRKVTAVLSDDRRLPVSASYVDDVREALKLKSAAKAALS